MATDQDHLFDGSLTPGEVLRQLLDERGWSQEQFADIIGRARQTVVGIMRGSMGITAETATLFAAAFGNSPADWLRLEAGEKLSRVTSETADVARRAKLYALLPIRDMQKRGWIADHEGNLDRLESQIKAFLGIESLDERPAFLVSTKRTNVDQEPTPPQRAWCARARQMATAMLLKNRFDPERLRLAARDLRELAAYPKEVRHLPRVMREYGIRFVVIEPLPGAKIDGAAFWLDTEKPVIAVSVRFDRVDAFWFTVMHEFSHIAHNDALSIDTEIEPGHVPPATDETEARANQEAATRLIDKAELDSFVQRVGPYYSRERVIQFAHAVQIHPGIIVGQLQHRGEIGYSALRDLLSKVRDTVTETAVTDGWGKSLSPSMLST